MGHSEIKEPTTLVISHTISVATMDFLKPISSSAYVTIPVATRNKNLTKRNLGYDRIQLVIKSVLLCFGPASWPHFLNGCLVAILDFSVSGLCRRHGFGIVTQVCFLISVSNFMHVLCSCRQKPNDFQLCRFQNGFLVILNNVQSQSTHCPLQPSPLGRGYPSRSLIYNF